MSHSRAQRQALQAAGDATRLQRRIGDDLIRVLLDGQKMIAAYGGMVMSWISDEGIYTSLYIHVCLYIYIYKNKIIHIHNTYICMCIYEIYLDISCIIWIYNYIIYNLDSCGMSWEYDIRKCLEMDEDSIWVTWRMT